MLPNLKILDFQKVTFKERKIAETKFAKESEIEFETKLKNLSIKDKIKLAVERARTVEEVNQIEVLLKSSKLSIDLLDQTLKQMNL